MEKRFLLFLPLVFFLRSPIIHATAACPANVEAFQYHSLSRSHIGVAVKLNGSGPYEFMLDTGAQITVIEPKLAEDLKLQATGTLNVVTVASHIEVPVVSAMRVEVGTVSLQNVRMAVEDLGPIQSEYHGLRGILGNNFLSRFDLLIDNSHRTLCFDDSHRMQSSLRGERVPVLPETSSNPESVSSQPILVSVHLPDDGKKGSVLRLDSGSNVPLLYEDHGARRSARVQGSTIGKQAEFVYAYTPERNVRIGAEKEIQIAFATPVGKAHLYSKAGEDGVLPTTLFKRVFISATDRVLIFDPR